MPLGKPKKKKPRKMKDATAKSMYLKLDVWVCPYCDRLNASTQPMQPGDMGVCFVCNGPANIKEVERCCLTI